MFTRKNPVRRAFTLIEILIVVVILGILAAIVIPQFTTASDDAMTSSAQSQLQTIRSQIELYRVQEAGALPAFGTTGWDDMVINDYLQGEPMNPFNDSIIVSAGAGVNGVAGDGWHWDTTTSDMYVLNADGTDMGF